jgi:hypothetical protein
MELDGFKKELLFLFRNVNGYTLSSALIIFFYFYFYFAFNKNFFINGETINCKL